MLQGGKSMCVKHIRSYSVAALQDLVQKDGGDWKLVPVWLDANDLRPLLRDYQDPTEVKKSKLADSGGLFSQCLQRFIHFLELQLELCCLSLQVL
jgi:hypothetical protein